MFLVGYLDVEVVNACHSVLPTPHAFWHWGLNISRGGGAEGAERSEIDEVGFWRKLSWEAVWVCEAGERISGPGVSLVNGRYPWKKPAGVG